MTATQAHPDRAPCRRATAGRRLLAALVASALLLLGPASAQASPDTTAKFTVTVIHAHNTKAGVDPQLRPLADYLHASFARFKASVHGIGLKVSIDEVYEVFSSLDVTADPSNRTCCLHSFYS